MTQLRIERVYHSLPDPASYRILVDRIWPRGIAKAKAQIDWWAKELAPSPELRRWFQHDPAKFPEFQERYRRELDENPAVAEAKESITAHLQTQDIVLLYGAKDEQHNQAVVLQAYLTQN
ncbi:DUF488 family protein [Lactobacillus sp. DCY120]|uniref:DUF488 family protein n=1 Tax=Bombilactobacillus apium TaxID=2675299 RepID=A0A850R739_9LACO|nr:DUF488 family protein [Bombilactobacillus apium]NVY96657.1 DUF488 family protein [Bombilactobacillus apium]